MTEYLEAFVEIEEPVGLSYHEFIRGSFDPAYRQLTDAQIDGLIERALAGMSVEEIEGFWDTVGRGLSSFGRTAAQLAPSVLPVAGAALGTVIGGPVGTQIGSSLGQLGGQLIGGAARADRGGGRPAQTGGVPVTPTGTPAPANQLMALIQHPAFLQSLLGRVLGNVGTTTVGVGPQKTPVSFGAFMNTVSSLANAAAMQPTAAAPTSPVAAPAGAPAAAPAPQPSRAAATPEPPPAAPEPAAPPAAPASGTTPSVEATAYLRDEYGRFVVDPANPDERAERVLELLREDYGNPTGAVERFDPVTEWLTGAALVK